MPAHLIQATVINRPGAIAIVQLVGESHSILQSLTGVQHWPLHQVRLVDFAGIDQGLAVRIDQDVAQLMPHGGPRVIQRLTLKLLELGAVLTEAKSTKQLSSRAIYPEAVDEIEALMLQTLARASSPLAIERLVEQPAIWRGVQKKQITLTDDDRAQSARLNRLVEPPIVVLAGRPNVGKSTLSNALLGRTMSMAMDLPGTTRDYTAARIELAGLVVDWHDTPGLRVTNDPIESRATGIAQRLMERADLLIAMRDHESSWPDLPREPQLRLINKSDQSNQKPEGDEIRISAAKGESLQLLVRQIRDSLVPPSDLHSRRPWLFDVRLLDYA